MAGAVGTKVLELFDPTREGPLSDDELENVRGAAWVFLLDDSADKSNLAYLIFKLASELTERRKAMAAVLS